MAVAAVIASWVFIESLMEGESVATSLVGAIKGGLFAVVAALLAFFMAFRGFPPEPEPPVDPRSRRFQIGVGLANLVLMMALVLASGLRRGDSGIDLAVHLAIFIGHGAAMALIFWFGLVRFLRSYSDTGRRLTGPEAG
jgi:hypothetical protein